MNRMKRIGRVVSIASIAGMLAAISADAAFAQSSGTSGAAASAQPAARHQRQQGLLRRALQLDSLSSAQRAAIDQLVQEQHTSRVPVRQADAQLLTSVAQQVESGTINPPALAPAIQARENAALAERGDAIQKLHDLLTPDQRSALVDAIESQAQSPHRDGGAPTRVLNRIASRLGLTPAQRQQIASNLSTARQGQDGAADRAARRQAWTAWLESFRTDSFQASSSLSGSARAAMDRRAERAEQLLQAALPVLTPAQRAQAADLLRARAARESHG